MTGYFQKNSRTSNDSFSIASGFASICSQPVLPAPAEFR
jgi:hypothetical protein